MRIISGMRRGHKLFEFEGDEIRPTTDRVKESIFNIIQSFVPGSACLDMFAGSGAMSMEALSRGARRAVLVDADKRSVDIIKKNVTSLKFSEYCDIINMSCFDYMDKAKEKFDIIFLDPPYNMDFIETALRGILEHDILADEGIIVLESDGTDFHDEYASLSVYRQRKYGRTYITVYKRSE